MYQYWGQDGGQGLWLLSGHTRGYRIDLTQTFKTMHGIDKVQSSTWFEHVDYEVCCRSSELETTDSAA